MICVSSEDDSRRVCKDLVEVKKHVEQIHADGDSISSIDECDEFGDPIEGGKQYGCEWSVNIVKL